MTAVIGWGQGRRVSAVALLQIHSVVCRPEESCTAAFCFEQQVLDKLLESRLGVGQVMIEICKLA